MPFSFGRKHSIDETGLLRGFTDWHCHILPGVDDGFPGMEESLAALGRYEELGVSEVWLTPHVMEDAPNATETLRDRYAELCAAYKGGVRLRLAAEYMMDNLFEARLAADDLLPLGGAGNHLLVETSYFNPPARLLDILKNTRSAGYFPVLAHPERYVYMDVDDCSALADSGVRLQLNLGSLAGTYGAAARDRALRLLGRGRYSLAGTDLHRLAQLGSILHARCLPGNVFKCLKKPDLLITI